MNCFYPRGHRLFSPFCHRVWRKDCVDIHRISPIWFLDHLFLVFALISKLMVWYCLLGNTLSLNTMVAETIVVSLLWWCVQVHAMYFTFLISQTRKIKAAPLLQIPAFEELLSLVLNYFWTIMWKVLTMRGLGSQNSH